MKPKPHMSLAFPRPCYRTAAISDRILKLLQLVNGFLQQNRKIKMGYLPPTQVRSNKRKHETSGISAKRV